MSELMVFKEIRSNISYNKACGIVEANRWLVDSTESVDSNTTLYLQKGKVIGKYEEESGTLFVRTI